MAPNLEHTTQHDPSYICSVPLDPQILTGYFLNFCKWKFARLENLHNPFLRDPRYLWKPDDFVAQDQSKGILIATAHDYDVTDAQQRPAIIIQRATTQVTPKQTIGDEYQIPQNLIGDHNPNFEATLGQRQQLVFITGAHRFLALNVTGGGAEILGIEMWPSFIDHQSIIQRDLGIMEVSVGPLQQAGRIEEYKEAWAVPFVVTYTYQRATILMQESPLLKAFTIDTSIPEC